MTRITVLGAAGFIGSHLVERLAREGVEYDAPPRDADLTQGHLGQVIYAIGLTADFRTRPFDTVEAHVSKLNEILRAGNFDKLVYLSSTRVYNPQLSVAEETATLQVNSANPSDLYNLSKLMGESIALHSGRKVSVVRLSNVYGFDVTSDNFLPSVIRDAVTRHKVTLQTSPDSVKDYISMDDVVDGLLNITRAGQQSMYNLASGRNVSNQELADEIGRLTGATFETAPNAVTSLFPRISIERMQQEFDFSPSALTHDLGRLVDQFKTRQQ
jgi:nucleoside-diphosphate-sugar epimerase